MQSTAITNDDLTSIVADIVGILGTAAADETSASGEALCASLAFEGPGELALVVHADEATVGQLAKSFFGEDVSHDDQIDALCEFANQCAGATKTMLEGEWTIGIPREGETSVTDAAVHGYVAVGAGGIKVSLGPPV